MNVAAMRAGLLCLQGWWQQSSTIAPPCDFIVRIVGSKRAFDRWKNRSCGSVLQMGLGPSAANFHYMAWAFCSGPFVCVCVWS